MTGRNRRPRTATGQCDDISFLLPTPVLTGSGSTGSPICGISGPFRTTPRFAAQTIEETTNYCKRPTPPHRYNRHSRSRIMGHSVRVFQVDAFTSRRFAGNPAGVVLDADALSSDDMQALARELNNGDTAFLLRPDADDHDLRLRFFTPRREAAFVGHATLAAHAVLAALKLEPRRRQKHSSGMVEVDSISGAWPPRIVIHLPPPKLQRSLDGRELSAVLEALALTHA